MWCFEKVNTQLSQAPATACPATACLRACSSQRSENVGLHEDLYTNVPSSLFIVLSSWNQPSLPTDEWPSCGISIPRNTTQQYKECTQQLGWISRELCWVKKSQFQRGYICMNLFLQPNFRKWRQTSSCQGAGVGREQEGGGWRHTRVLWCWAVWHLAVVGDIWTEVVKLCGMRAQLYWCQYSGFHIL